MATIRWRGGWLRHKRVAKVPASGFERMPGCHSNFKRITLHNEGVDRKCDGGAHVENLARYVRDKGIFYHFVYCPDCGHWAQIVPISAAARSMKGGPVCSAGNSANKHGRYNVQVCFAGYGYKKLPPALEWKGKAVWRLLAKKVGNPPRAMSYAKIFRSRKRWRNIERGWAGHQHGPNDDHTDILGNRFDFPAFKRDVLGL